jgi:hypothetical protein
MRCGHIRSLPAGPAARRERTRLLARTRRGRKGPHTANSGRRCAGGPDAGAQVRGAGIPSFLRQIFAPVRVSCGPYAPAGSLFAVGCGLARHLRRGLGCRWLVVLSPFASGGASGSGRGCVVRRRPVAVSGVGCAVPYVVQAEPSRPAPGPPAAVWLLRFCCWWRRPRRWSAPRWVDDGIRNGSGWVCLLRGAGVVIVARKGRDAPGRAAVLGERSRRCLIVRPETG